MSFAWHLSNRAIKDEDINRCARNESAESWWKDCKTKISLYSYLFMELSGEDALRFTLNKIKDYIWQVIIKYNLNMILRGFYTLRLTTFCWRLRLTRFTILFSLSPSPPFSLLFKHSFLSRHHSKSPSPRSMNLEAKLKDISREITEFMARSIWIESIFMEK